MKIVHVAVGVLIDQHQRVLVALRNENAHQGGLWEFPGGKCEAGEQVSDALRREFFEEIGIEISQDAPLCNIRHDYGDKQVWLEVRRILSYTGEATGKEGQAIRWQPLGTLDATQFPAANKIIIDRIQLSDRIAITGTAQNHSEFLQRFDQLLQMGLPTVHLRQGQFSDQEFLSLVRECKQRCLGVPVGLILSTSISLFEEQPTQGLHVSSRILETLTRRPVAQEYRFSASCHSLAQLQHAQKMGANYAFLSPVAKTLSHPQQTPLGWQTFTRLASQVDVPVYALGGMTAADINTAQTYGAPGIAAISAFWEAEQAAN